MSVPVLIDKGLAVQDYRSQAAAILEQAKALVVIDADSRAQAVTILGRISTILNQAEAGRRSFLKPVEAWKDSLNAEFRSVMLPVSQADAILRERILTFAREEQRKADEAAALARKAQEEAIRAKREADDAMARALEADRAGQHEAVAEALDTAAAADTVAQQEQVKAVDLRAVAMAPKRTTVTEEATSTVRKLWDFNVINTALVPRHLMKPDEPAIRAEIVRLGKTGLTAAQINIPGIAVFQKESIAIKTL